MELMDRILSSSSRRTLEVVKTQVGPSQGLNLAKEGAKELWTWL